MIIVDVYRHPLGRAPPTSRRSGHTNVTRKQLSRSGAAGVLSNKSEICCSIEALNYLRIDSIRCEYDA